MRVADTDAQLITCGRMTAAGETRQFLRSWRRRALAAEPRSIPAVYPLFHLPATGRHPTAGCLVLGAERSPFRTRCPTWRRGRRQSTRLRPHFDLGPYVARVGEESSVDRHVSGLGARLDDDLVDVRGNDRSSTLVATALHGTSTATSRAQPVAARYISSAVCRKGFSVIFGV